MASDRYQPYLGHLLHISHVLGCNERFVQAGGGNTSVKCADGRTMLIKASGTPLGRMDETRGWVAVDLKALGAVFEDKKIRTLAAAVREKRVLEILSNAVIEPRDSRPSVETPLHAILEPVIMHSHPVAGNGLGCHRDGETILAELFADRPNRPPLWVPYIDPGSVLAFGMSDIIAQYRDRHGSTPDIILLANHGLFVTDTNVSACVVKHADVLERIERWFDSHRAAGAPLSIRRTVEAAVREVMGPSTLVRFSTRLELVEAARGAGAAVFKGALSPDHVVYTGPCAAFVPPRAPKSAVARALVKFSETNGAQARLLVIKGATVAVIGDSVKKLDAAEALALSAVQIASYAGTHTRFLSPAGVSFIMNWEAEHYRAKQ